MGVLLSFSLPPLPPFSPLSFLPSHLPFSSSLCCPIPLSMLFPFLAEEASEAAVWAATVAVVIFWAQEHVWWQPDRILLHWSKCCNLFTTNQSEGILFSGWPTLNLLVPNPVFRLVSATAIWGLLCVNIAEILWHHSVRCQEVDATPLFLVFFVCFWSLLRHVQCCRRVCSSSNDLQTARYWCFHESHVLA